MQGACTDLAGPRAARRGIPSSAWVLGPCPLAGLPSPGSVSTHSAQSGLLKQWWMSTGVLNNLLHFVVRLPQFEQHLSRIHNIC